MNAPKQTQTQTKAAATINGLDGIEISDEMALMLANMESQKGDPRGMSAEERAGYVATLCRALRLNPLTRPAQFINLSGKEVLYLTRTATDQLAAMHSLNRRTIDGPKVVDICGTKVGVCTVEVSLPSGRSETATATLPAADFVNLYMKLETKAKRRATLSILGLGVLTEEETETIPGARRVVDDTPPRGTLSAPVTSLAPLGVEAQHPTMDSMVAHRPPSQPPAAASTDDVEPAPEDDATAPFTADVDAMELPGEAVSIWLKHRATIQPLGDAARESAWRYLVARVEHVGKMKGAKAWLKRALADEISRRQSSGVADHQAA